ncbi:MAG: exopolysaccharide biosynthesis protein, partial [Sphingorhabdus sp.]
MNKHSPIKLPASLLERASEKYDFGAALRVGAGTPAPVADPAPVAPVVVAQPLPVPAAPAPIAPVAPTS